MEERARPPALFDQADLTTIAAVEQPEGFARHEAAFGGAAIGGGEDFFAGEIGIEGLAGDGFLVATLPTRRGGEAEGEVVARAGDVQLPDAQIGEDFAARFELGCAGWEGFERVGLVGAGGLGDERPEPVLGIVESLPLVHPLQ